MIGNIHTPHQVAMRGHEAGVVNLENRKKRRLSLQAFAAALTLWVLSGSALAQVPRSSHVVLVIDENTTYSNVINNMPWLVGKGSANGYATNYHSDTGGSLMDYLWLASGSCHSAANCTLPPGTHDFNCNGNDCYYPGTTNSDPITDDNIFRELNNRGMSWKVYAQSYAAAGGTVTTKDNANGTTYYRRHNGATWYSDILSNVDGSASKIVDLSQLTTDLNNGALPQFVIIAPDGNHDAHDCPVGIPNCTTAQRLQAADSFLQSTLSPILAKSYFQSGGDGLLVVTFDECGGGTNQGCGASVYTALVGPKVIPNKVSGISYKHENALRTMLDALGITNYPGAAASAADMSDFFNPSGETKPVVTVSTPANNSNVNSPVNIQASATPSSGYTISGWHIYVDSVDSFSGGATSSINTNLSIATGTHTVLVRAWDTSGASGDQILTLTVNATKPTVTVSTPLNNTTVGSPVNFQASASPTAGHTISGWYIYDNNNAVYNTGAVSSINTNITMASGSHTVIVRAWDTSGAYGDQTLTLTVAATKPAVVVSTPPNNSNVISPTNLQASATPSSGYTISGWHIYIDSVDSYSAGAVNSINTNLAMSAGQHTVMVRAWDTSGAYGDQTENLNVAPQGVAVNISTPANGASVNSPVNIQASGKSAHTITGWHIYVDSADVFGQNNVTSINANVTMSSGTHTVMVRAWDSTGAYGDETIAVTVP